jgi:uncharacterized protein (UPF0332 family)
MEMKMAFSYKDCISKKLLKRVPPSRDKAERSMKKAKKWLEEAEKTHESKTYNSSVLASYMVMFHAARSILFYNGFREKSHACVARYLEEKYVRNGKLEKKWISLLDHHREVRHDDQYNLSFFSTKDDAVKALKSASSFFKRMNLLLNNLIKG